MPGELRVLYLTMNANRGSTTLPLEGWFQQLRPRGLRPVLVSHQAAGFHAWAVEQGVPAYPVPLPPPSKSRPWGFVRSLWRLRRLVRRHGIQLIHCNEQNIYPIGYYLGRLCRVPVVVSIHFSMTREYCQWAFGGRRRPARIFFTSRGNLETCRPAMTGVVDEKYWRLLPNGLDLEHFRPDHSARQAFRANLGVGNVPLIGAACATRPRKQLEHLFEAAARLSRTDLRVVLAGGPVPGDEAYSRQLLDDARRRLGEQFIYLGHQQELRGLYNGLDLFVNTSQEEACSLSILESLACGCPVVGYPSKSVDEQVLPGGGEIVPQDDVAVLTAALARWLNDPQRLAAGRLGARRRAETDYDTRTRSEQLWQEYRQVLIE
jgi:glycosyltransferase involved in cell wall biosynthesis